MFLSYLKISTQEPQRGQPIFDDAVPRWVLRQYQQAFMIILGDTVANLTNEVLNDAQRRRA